MTGRGAVVMTYACGGWLLIGMLMLAVMLAVPASRDDLWRRGGVFVARYVLFVLLCWPLLLMVDGEDE